MTSLGMPQCGLFKGGAKWVTLVIHCILLLLHFYSLVCVS